MDGYSVNNYWLKRNKDTISDGEINLVSDTIRNSIAYSSSFQQNAKVNGVEFGLAVTRNETNKCKVTLLPGDKIHIGDTIEVLDETWLCTDIRTDEYGASYGIITLCNYEFVYQDIRGRVINKKAVVENGSYYKGDDKAISVIDGTYKCYLPIDEDTSCLYIDKRLAIGTAYDQNGEEILEVGKVTWIDRITFNRGEGSHLLFMSLTRDVYNKERDNKDLLICDYVRDGDASFSEQSHLVINGKDSIRIGTSRTYSVMVSDGEESLVNDLEWSVSDVDGITLTQSGTSCVVNVPLKEALIGAEILLTCSDKLGRVTPANKKMAVISIG